MSDMSQSRILGFVFESIDRNTDILLFAIILKFYHFTRSLSPKSVHESRMEVSC